VTGYHAVLLAAGAGSRFGGRKLLTAWRGEPLVCAATRIALAAPVEGCIAVTGCDADQVEAALGRIGDERLTIVGCPDWGEGLSASLRCGLGALPSSSLGVVVFLADMPLVPTEAAAPLLEALRQGALAAEYRSGARPAHPVAFARELYPELVAVRGDQGGRALLVDRAGVVRLTTARPGAIFDIDRRSDLDALARHDAGPAAGDADGSPPGPRPPAEQGRAERLPS